MDPDFARAHRVVEEDATLVIVHGGDGEVLQWQRFVATFDYILKRSIVGPEDGGVQITQCGVVLHMPTTMVERLGIRRSTSGHADSLTADHGLLFMLSNRERLVYLSWSGGRKKTYQISRAERPWQRMICVPITVAMTRAIREEFMRG